jgi:hypothetical protein
MLDTELGLLQSRYHQAWSPQSDIEFLATRLRLYSFAFAKSEQHSLEDQQMKRSLDFIPLAYTTATRLVKASCLSPVDSAFWTAHVRTAVVFAVFFLLKISDHVKFQNDEKTEVRNTISQVWTLLRSWSVTEDDHFARVCEVIEYVSEVGTSPTSSWMSWNSSSRMSVNLVVDVVQAARARFRGGIRENKTTASGVVGVEMPALYPSWAGFTNTSIHSSLGEWDAFLGEI